MKELAHPIPTLGNHVIYLFCWVWVLVINFVHISERVSPKIIVSCFLIYLFFDIVSIKGLFFKDFIYLFLETGEGREKRGRETSIHDCLLCAPYWGPGPKPRHVPWLAIKPVTLRFTVLSSVHLATPARAEYFNKRSSNSGRTESGVWWPCARCPCDHSHGGHLHADLGGPGYDQQWRSAKV